VLGMYDDLDMSNRPNDQTNPLTWQAWPTRWPRQTRQPCWVGPSQQHILVGCARWHKRSWQPKWVEQAWRPSWAKSGQQPRRVGWLGQRTWRNIIGPYGPSSWSCLFGSSGQPSLTHLGFPIDWVVGSA